MTAIRCRAKDATLCRVHGLGFPSGFNRVNGMFTFVRPSLAEHKLESEKFNFMLSEAERVAVKGYLDQDYSNLTPYLYSQENHSSHNFGEQVKLIDSALAKYETLQPEGSRVVYRAVKLVSEGALSSTEQVADAVGGKYVVGETFTVEGYMSTTENPQALFDFLTQSYYDIPKRDKPRMYSIDSLEEFLNMSGDESLRNVVYEISTPSGAPVSSFGQTYADKEQEFLLGRGKTFKVVEVIPYSKLVNPVQSHVLNSAHATVVRLVEVLS